MNLRLTPVVIGLMLACSPLFALDKVNICWESELKPPYLMSDDGKNLSGIAVDMINEIFKRNNVAANNYLRPWKRCLGEVTDGKAEVVPNSSYKEKRKSFAMFTDPIYATHLSLYYRKQQFSSPPSIKSIEDMSKFNIGGVSGFNYSQYKDKLQIKASAANRVGLVKKLHDGRHDFAILQKEVVQMLAKQGQVSLAGLDAVPDPIKPSKNYHVLVSLKAPEKQTIVDMINNGLKDLQADGTQQKILEKYLAGN